MSSSLIRRLIIEGDVPTAGQCLGRDYTLEGRVVGGEKRGRMLQFPTANLSPADVVTPGDGIYAARARIGGQTFPAAVSIGSTSTRRPGSRRHHRQERSASVQSPVAGLG